MDLVLRRIRVADVHVLAVTGDVDLASLPRFTDSLMKLVADAPAETVAVDLDGTGLVDDAALGILLGAAGRARQGGGDLTVVSTDSRLRGRLSDTGFDRAVDVHDSISAR